jgi:hypothetical protein
MLAAVHEEIVAGGQPGDFCMVRHLRLSGNQEDIGSMLAELAERNFGIGPQPAPDPILTRARRRWRNPLLPRARGSRSGDRRPVGRRCRR